MTLTQHLLGSHADDCPAGCRAHLYRRRWLSVLLGMAAVTLATGIADPVLGVDLTVDTGSGPFTVDPLYVTLTSLGVGLAAWALLEILERRTRRPRVIWTVTACLVFVLSLTGPLSATTDAAVAVLMSLHLLVAVALIVGLGGSSRPAARR